MAAITQSHLTDILTEINRQTWVKINDLTFMVSVRCPYPKVTYNEYMDTGSLGHGLRSSVVHLRGWVQKNMQLINKSKQVIPIDLLGVNLSVNNWHFLV